MNAILTNMRRPMPLPSRPGGPEAVSINRIMTLTGQVPDADRYRNYLSTLKPYELENRLKTMEAQGGRESNGATFRFPYAAKHPTNL